MYWWDNIHAADDAEEVAVPLASKRKLSRKTRSSKSYHVFDVAP